MAVDIKAPGSPAMEVVEGILGMHESKAEDTSCGKPILTVSIVCSKEP